MFLSNFSVKKPVATVVLIVAMMAMGLLALSKLKVNQNPDVEVPIIVVDIPYPGASPETSEREITNRIEKQMLAIQGVTEVNSNSYEGGSSIWMEFDFGRNLIEASDDVRNAIASVRYKLPVEMREPIMRRIDPASEPVMSLALSSSSQSHAEISRYAEDVLADKFRAIDGVSTVTVNGALRRELSVLLRAEKLREFGVSVSDVTNALRTQNTNAPVGKLRSELDEKGIRLVGRIERPEDFSQVVVKRNGDQIVRLNQVAEIKDGYADINSLSMRSGKPNVGIQIARSRDASTVSLAKKVHKVVEETQKELSEGTKLEVVRDGGDDAQMSLNNVIEALVLGAILTIFVVYAFLNSWRSTLITALSLPTSVLAAFIAVWLCGFTLNFMTLLGLSLAIGVLIDDAIVVRENIVRHMELGSDRRTAALEGTAEIGMAVAATTFSIMAVFIPVAFMPGMAGQWFGPFALTVTCSVIVSLFISFTLDPMLSAYWGDPPGHHHAKKKGIGAALDKFNHWFDHQADRYGNVIAWALHHRKWMAAIAVASFVGAIALHATFGGSSFLPKSDQGTLMVEIRVPASSSVEYARRKVEAAAELARSIPEVKDTNSNANTGGGRIYVDIGKRSTRKRSGADIAVELREKVGRLVGAEYTVIDDLNGGGKPVQIQFTGPDSRKLMDLTTAYMEKLRQVPGAVDVTLSEQDPKNELQIVLDRGLANAMGISINDAAQSLRVAFAGIEVGDWVDPSSETRDVAVRLHPDDRVNTDSIERLPIAVSGTGMMVPLEQIASITMGKGPAAIRHKNGERMITVSANAQGRSPGEVTADAMKLAKSFDFPPGYGLQLGGAGQDQQEVFSAMGIALISGIGLMYLILVMQFGSFTAPMGVMLSLPLSLIGVVLALLLTKNTLNLMSLIGVIMLMGLVAKNAILLLDAARALEKEGMDREEALMQAGRKRLRPILMTTFALIAGMLPVALALGDAGQFYQPLAIAIIGGTITSTFLTLLVVPTFYDSIEIARDRMYAKFNRRAGRFNPALAFLMTFVEAILTLTFVRFVFRGIVRIGRLVTGRGRGTPQPV
ncbi:efflux RND transporter permease subunit [Massilia sp. IC2-477]|uniref:efflux RND transporter permease subunit n=1 Tax=unclassified Massilia TaxID=2609279 RepID=UPI001D111F8C|nr:MULTISPECIES: efflux RND transporter permease subunit [unclassified Massilia]MCC2956483.1 efflux RND transporter permease subunit [Massilia sp. IC2-477]MCC2972152.1 efflux RND transporter permease subunit [Massilia sp. IC2-476]